MALKAILVRGECSYAGAAIAAYSYANEMMKRREKENGRNK
jgi:hypothetical protein